MLIAEVPIDACLGYTNTLGWRGRATPRETLGDFGDLVDWIAGIGSLPADAVQALKDRARAHQALAAQLLAEAIALREMIHRMFSALASDQPVADEDLATLNRALAEVPPRNRLAAASGGYGWRIEPSRITAPALLAPVLWSAGDLMASDRLGRVRLCDNETCLWLFLDESKAGNRRWCDMASCGNRAKARRHYQKKRRGATTRRKSRPRPAPARARAAGCRSRARS